MRRLLVFLVSPEELQAIRRTLGHTDEVNSNDATSFPPREPDREPRALRPPGCDDGGLESSIRLSSRVFVVGSVLLSIIGRIRTLSEPSRCLKTRLPLSLSVLLLMHRFLYCAATRLQLILSNLSKSGAPIKSNLRRFVVSPLMPSLAAALSGIALIFVPSENARLTISAYVFTKTMDYLSNALHDMGSLPTWFGSWLLFPFSFAQLFHAYFADERSVPFIYRNAIATFPAMFKPKAGNDSPGYNTAVRMSEIANLNFPAFNSTILFPEKSPTPESIGRTIRSAHPAMKQLSCAISHHKTVSCLQAYVEYSLHQFGKNTKPFFALYSLSLLSRSRRFEKSPLIYAYGLASKVLRTSAFVTLAVSSSWSALCLLQKTMPKWFLNRNCFYLSGFLGGLAAFWDRENSRAIFLDAARNGTISWWKANKESRRLKGMPSADVLLLVISIAILNALYDLKPHSINSAGARKVIELLRGKRANTHDSLQPAESPNSLGT